MYRVTGLTEIWRRALKCFCVAVQDVRAGIPSRRHRRPAHVSGVVLGPGETTRAVPLLRGSGSGAAALSGGSDLHSECRSGSPKNAHVRGKVTFGI